MAEKREVIVDGKVMNIGEEGGVFVSKISPDGTVESFVDGSADNILYILADGVCNFVRQMESRGFDAEFVMDMINTVATAMMLEHNGDTAGAVAMLRQTKNELTNLQ